jgi:hypothetical protein
LRDAYTAPEQNYGGRGAATVQTDVYALGVVLAEALTGKTPFQGDTDLSEAMLRDELARSGLVDVTEAMKQVVLKATRRKSKERYAHTLEMRLDLLDLCASASPDEVRAFLDDLFPVDAVPRVSRDELLTHALAHPPPPSGHLLTSLPQQPVIAVRGRARVPSDLEIEAATGTRPQRAARNDDATHHAFDDEALPTLEDHEVQDADAVARALVGRVVGRAQDRELVADAESAVTTSAPRSSGRGRAPLAPRTIPSTHEETEPHIRRPARARTVAPPAPVAVTTSRTPPALWVALGLSAGVAAAFGTVLLLRELSPPPPATQVVVAAAPVATTPATVAPAAALAPPTATTPAPVAAEPTPQKVAVAVTKPVTTSMPAAAASSPPQATPSTVSAGPGSLRVSTTPPMEIIVDSRTVGTGTAELPLAAGAHLVRARDKALGLDLSRKVNIVTDRIEIVELEARKGHIAVEAPDGCDVVIDGKPVGKSPLASVEVYEGTHHVLVRQGTIDYRHDVPVQAGVESTLQVQFHP